MKLSISLPEDDVAALDEYIRMEGLPSRSAGLRHAVRLLRLPHLEQDYESAWEEWEESGEHASWETTITDGLTRATR